MTTIAVVKKNNMVCIASESLTTFGSTKFNEEHNADVNKIMEWGESYIGIVGSIALNMILRDVIINEKKTPDFSSSVEIYKYFKKLHPVLKEKYYLKTDEDENDPVESSQFEIVIVNKYGMFGVHSLRDVYCFKKFWAYGSGKDYAKGAMSAVYDLEDYDAEKIAISGCWLMACS